MFEDIFSDMMAVLIVLVIILYLYAYIGFDNI